MNNQINTVKLPINKRIFKFEYLLILILIVLLLCLFLSNSGIFNFIYTSSETSLDNYENVTEKKLENILKEIDGVGNVNVMLTVDGTTKKEYLKNTQTKRENGVEIIEETTVFVNGKPQLIKEINPDVLGVLVICQGADNVKVKMAITEAILTVLTVSSDNIRILKKK